MARRRLDVARAEDVPRDVAFPRVLEAGATLVSVESWSPHWAPHVVGTWTPRTVDEETGEVDPSIVRIVCGVCNATHRVDCKTGNVRGWINRFASVHYHADPLDPKQAVRQAEVARAARRESGSTAFEGPKK